MTAAYENIQTETKGRVGIIRLNRPKALNALCADLVRELGQALDAFEAENILANVQEMGAKLVARLEQFIGNYPELFEEVRGRGLLLGLKLKAEPRDFVAHLRDNHGLLTVSGGDNTMRIVPPLVIDDSHLDEFMDKLSQGAASFQLAEVSP